MSYYYNYYIGYKNKETGMIYLHGPYMYGNKLRPALSRSRSFASSLHERFYPIPEESKSESINKAFTQSEYYPPLEYLPFSELPNGSFMKRGYFLVEDVARYESELESGERFIEFDGFCDHISPTVYAEMLKNEIMCGKYEQPEDEEEPTKYNASDYMYYAYPDYMSEEWEAEVLRMAADALWFYTDEPIEYVVIKTEG